MEGDKESLKWMENNKSLSTKRVMEKFCCADEAESRQKVRGRESYTRPCVTPYVVVRATFSILFPILFALQPTKTLSEYTRRYLNINMIWLSRAGSLYFVIISIFFNQVVIFLVLPFLSSRYTVWFCCKIVKAIY